MEQMNVNKTLIFNALKYGGLREIKGSRDDETIDKMYRTAGASWIANKDGSDDKYAWCSAFMCQVAHDSKVFNPRTVRARNWLKLTDAVAFKITGHEELSPGDVVVLKRGRGGHVGLFMYEQDDDLFLISGNQSNQVCVKPYDASLFLAGFRMKSL